ncbi:MAG: hypothetical protein WC768_04675 [Patescibacteria group bacterium]|jgi:hypothetical protein
MTTKNFKIIILAGTILVLFCLPVMDLAQAAQGGDIQGLLGTAASKAGYKATGSDSGTGLAEFAGSLVQTFISILGILFISYTIYGGFLWMTAAGNEEKVTKSKKTIASGIIGLIIIFSSAAIYYFVKNALTANSGGGVPYTSSGDHAD